MTVAAEKIGRESVLTATARPRLGFLGTGWIGRNRMEAIAKSGSGDIAAIFDPSEEMAEAARSVSTDAKILNSYNELLGSDLDGIVIATPSAMHAEQAIAALERGHAVFCQKPLARTAEETRRAIDATRAADRLLSVDFSYRFISGVREMRELIQTGQLGKVFAADLVFHNAYGPDKPWFYDPKLSGGGCLMDLGSHLIDVAVWILGGSSADNFHSQLLAGGEPLSDRSAQVEDFAAAQFRLACGTNVRLSCSWNLNAGQDAVIEASFYGTKGGASLKNVNGSFFDFKVRRYSGTYTEEISSAADGSGDWNWEWGGRAAVEWTRRLAAGERFDPECEQLIEVAKLIDRIYEN